MVPFRKFFTQLNFDLNPMGFKFSQHGGSGVMVVRRPEDIKAEIMRYIDKNGKPDLLYCGMDKKGSPYYGMFFGVSVFIQVLIFNTVFFDIKFFDFLDIQFCICFDLVHELQPNTSRCASWIRKLC